MSGTGTTSFRDPLNLYNTVCADFKCMVFSIYQDDWNTERFDANVYLGFLAVRATVICVYESISAIQTHLLCVSDCIDSAGQLFSRHCSVQQDIDKN